MPDVEVEVVVNDDIGAEFQRFWEECGSPLFFAAVADDGDKLRMAYGVTHPFEALFLAYKLRKLAAQLEEDVE